MSLNEVAASLRKRLTELRYDALIKNKTLSLHVNAIDISLSLVELSLEDNRAIRDKEENWFRAGYYLDYALGNSEWEDMIGLYDRMVEEVKKKNFFR